MASFNIWMHATTYRHVREHLVLLHQSKRAIVCMLRALCGNVSSHLSVPVQASASWWSRSRHSSAASEGPVGRDTPVSVTSHDPCIAQLELYSNTDIP